ncbi:hypothetical protein BGZ80_009877 [Entomortierella chlamydospora]|uniref:F-box domain-containing protein n=1 Tax=Entomortierella chlamydospora TaxID=101097 RepID=A0A9P6T0A3_9FUNG|nr:hypothetical protein BGZ79_002136 [Entomortierella chlamydospora]KAG0015408.1 hypothetical protein BGZ80_009877 [Entomortierella chlamydospora]
MSSASNVLSARDRVLSIPELVQGIVQFLRPIHLSQLRLTSKRFHNAFTPYVTLAVSQDYYKDCESALKALTDVGSMVKSLRVDALGNESNLEIMLERSRAIERVDFRAWTSYDRLFYKILECQPTLKDLTLTLCGDSIKANIADLLSAIARQAPPLETFSLTVQVIGNIKTPWSNISSILDACSTIRNLSFRGFNISRQEDEPQQPQIQSLALSDAHFGHSDILFFLHTMPGLRSLSLHLYKEPAQVFHTLMGDLTYPSKNILTQLTKLKVVATRKSHITGLVRFIQDCCPRINDLELGGECQYVSRGDVLGLLDHFNLNDITLKRLAIDYIPGSYVEDWIRRMLERCCPELEELELGGGVQFFIETQDYIYKWRKSGEFSMKQQEQKFWFPFSSTLTKLHLNNLITSSGPHWYFLNQMLRSMPLLEDLAVMGLLSEYSLFDGLGNDNALPRPKHHPLEYCIFKYLDSNNVIPLPEKQREEEETVPYESQDWTKERPFLRFLKIGLQPSVGFEAEVWNRELVNRFRFLEHLSIKTDLSHPEMELLGEWEETLRPGLGFTLLRLGMSSPWG